MSAQDAIRVQLEARAASLGFTVVYRLMVADPKTPAALPFQIAGRCDMMAKEIIVSTHRGYHTQRSKAEMNAILAHELEHAAGAEWAADNPEFGLRCGGMR